MRTSGNIRKYCCFQSLEAFHIPCRVSCIPANNGYSIFSTFIDLGTAQHCTFQADCTSPGKSYMLIMT